MGQEESTPISDTTPPLTLASRGLASLARYIHSPQCRRIAVLTGAGISTSAGIPDFRSPTTGLYANLSRLNLPYAEAVFSIEYFRQRPEAFYTLARELYPGRFRPTVAHSFVYLLERKGVLLRHFTQNIDCLDRVAGVSGDKVVEAHGSFAAQRCVDCKTGFPDAEMKEHVLEARIPRCVDGACGGLVKPDIVFFGEALPAEFFAQRGKVAEADLVIVMGTSLTVQPFASLPGMAGEGVPRLLINLEQVGGLGSRADDVLLLGDCDAGVRKLAEAVGWLDELEELWEETGRRFGVEPAAKKEKQDEAEKTSDEKLEDEIAKLTKDVDESLRLGQDNEEKARKELAAKVKEQITSPSEEKASAPLTVESSSKEPSSPKGDGGGLAHVFPHVEKKSAL